MTLIVILTVAQADTGPFNIFSNADGYLAALATNVPKAALLAGYPIDNAPEGTTMVKLKSVGLCRTAIDVPVTRTRVIEDVDTKDVVTTTTTTTEIPKTTTSTSTSTTTKELTTTTTTSSTTTTTTTKPVMSKTRTV